MQPIETAPRHPRQVLLLYGEEYGRRIWGRGYYFKGVPGDGEGWITSAFYTEPEDDMRGSFTPTHWMPMPASPERDALLEQQEQKEDTRVDEHTVMPPERATASENEKAASGCPKEHELKCWPDYYDPIERGLKTFEIRNNDRDFHVDDVIWLREFTPGVGLTGRSLRRRVDYITSFGQQRGFVVMGLRKLDPAVVAPIDDATGCPRAAESSCALCLSLQREVARLTEELEEMTRLRDSWYASATNLINHRAELFTERGGLRASLAALRTALRTLRDGYKKESVEFKRGMGDNSSSRRLDDVIKDLDATLDLVPEQE